MAIEWRAGPDGRASSWADSCMGEGSYGTPHQLGDGLVVECLSPFACTDELGGPFGSLELAEWAWRRHVARGHHWHVDEAGSTAPRP